jgi:hypothetical protein
MDNGMDINYEEALQWVFAAGFITAVYFKMQSLRQKVWEKHALATRSIEDIIKPILGVSLVYMLTIYILQESGRELNLNFMNSTGMMFVSYLCVGDFKKFRPPYVMFTMLLPGMRSEEHAIYFAYFNALSLLMFANVEARLCFLLCQLKSSKDVTKKQRKFCQHADKLAEHARVRVALAFAVASTPLAFLNEYLVMPARVANLGIYMLLINPKCKVLDILANDPESVEHFAVLQAYKPLSNHKIKDKVFATVELIS